ENLLHFIERECAQCLRTHIAARCDTKRERCRGLIIRSFTNGNHIAGTKGPKDLLDGRACLGRHVLECVSPLDGLLDVFDALLAERGEDNESGHRNLRSWPPSRLPHATTDCCLSTSGLRADTPTERTEMRSGFLLGLVTMAVDLADKIISLID